MEDSHGKPIRLPKLETIEGPEVNRLREWYGLNEWWLDLADRQQPQPPPTSVGAAVTVTFSV